MSISWAGIADPLARFDARSDSDLDILIELEPDAPVDLFDHIGLTHYLADLFPVRVDVAERENLKAHVRPRAEREAVYAF